MWWRPLLNGNGYCWELFFLLSEPIRLLRLTAFVTVRKNHQALINDNTTLVAIVRSLSDRISIWSFHKISGNLTLTRDHLLCRQFQNQLWKQLVARITDAISISSFMLLVWDSIGNNLKHITPSRCLFLLGTTWTRRKQRTGGNHVGFSSYQYSPKTQL